MKSLNKLCIGFYGTSEFSLSFLKELFSQDIKISYIVTKPPIASGRGKQVNISPVHEWGLNNKIDVLTPSDMKDKKFLDYVKKRKIDFNIIVAYGNVLTKEIINIPSETCQNPPLNTFNHLQKYPSKFPGQVAERLFIE